MVHLVGIKMVVLVVSDSIQRPGKTFIKTTHAVRKLTLGTTEKSMEPSI